MFVHFLFDSLVRILFKIPNSFILNRSLSNIKDKNTRNSRHTLCCYREECVCLFACYSVHPFSPIFLRVFFSLCLEVNIHYYYFFSFRFCASLFHSISIQSNRTTYMRCMQYMHMNLVIDCRATLKHVCCVLTAHILLISLDNHNFNHILSEIFHEEKNAPNLIRSCKQSKSWRNTLCSKWYTGLWLCVYKFVWAYVCWSS